MVLQHQSLVHLKERLKKLPGDWMVLPGHQYALEDGRNPTWLSVDELLKDNKAMTAAGDWERFQNLDFLSFNDSMAEEARRQKAGR